MNPETTKLLSAFLINVISGGGTYAGARWLFGYLEFIGVIVPPRLKRLLVLPICFVIVAAAVALQVSMGIAPLTPDLVLVALTTAFAASQIFHAAELAG